MCCSSRLGLYPLTIPVSHQVKYVWQTLAHFRRYTLRIFPVASLRSEFVPRLRRERKGFFDCTPLAQI